MNSKIFVGKVTHSRLQPKIHSFSYRMYALFIDLDEIPALCQQIFGFGQRVWHFVRYRRRDYHAPKISDLKTAVQLTVRELSGLELAGPVRMLTQLRILNYTFNPVTFYYCYDSGNNLQAIMAEIENTPWSERYCYVVPVASQNALKHRAEFAKKFHVSPFMPMNQHYQWEFTTPGDNLWVHMKSYEEGQLKFTATMPLTAQPLSSWTLWKNLLRFPLMPQKVTCGIYLQALLLTLKKVPFFDHPNPDSQIHFSLKARRKSNVS